MELRLLTRADVLELYGHGFNESMRGVAVVSKGRVIGIGGVLHTAPLQAFSRLTNEIRKSPKMIVKAGKRLVDIMKQYEAPIYALADKNERDAGAFLRHLGFEHFESTTIGEVYQWAAQ